MRIADPFIMVTHVIGSLRIIQDFGQQRAVLQGSPTLFASLELRNRRGGYVRLRQRSYPGSVAHSAGIDRRIVHSTGVGRAPRNTTDRHVSHRPRTSGSRKSSHCPKPACPPPCPPRANEAAGGVKTMNNAIATFTEVLDMGSAPMIHWNGEVAVTLM